MNLALTFYFVKSFGYHQVYWESCDLYISSASILFKWKYYFCIVYYYFANKEGNIRVIDFILCELSPGWPLRRGHNEELLLPGAIISRVSSIGETSDSPGVREQCLSVWVSSPSDTRLSDASVRGWGISDSPVSPISHVSIVKLPTDLGMGSWHNLCFKVATWVLSRAPLAAEGGTIPAVSAHSVLSSVERRTARRAVIRQTFSGAGELEWLDSCEIIHESYQVKCALPQDR